MSEPLPSILAWSNPLGTIELWTPIWAAGIWWGPPSSVPLASIVLAAYYAVLAPLALLGLHRLWLLATLARAERSSPKATPRAPAADGEWPVVTVQLPIFNEPWVAPRLLEAVSRLDYPRDRLEIQVLDDSTDDTTARLRVQVERLRAEGVDVRLLHRDDRTGYKAGALEAGTACARGELIAIFDADFVPPSDFLRNTVPSLGDPEVGMVQARWGHLNRDSSLLTRVQALLLDGHFLVEQAARSASGRLFNFNGTAGVWRRRAIVEAGGWQHDTLTEDLDLSYRAQLAGWRFEYLASVVAPAELPTDLDAFRGQQRRWTRGSAQCLRKLVGPVLGARLSPAVKTEALVHLGANLSHPLMVALTVLLFPAMWLRARHAAPALVGVDVAILLAASGSVIAYYLDAARRAGVPRRRALALQPALMALGIGMSWHNARAAVGGLVRRGGVFVRTPKLCVTDVDEVGSRGHDAASRTPMRASTTRLPIAESLLSLHLIGCAILGVLAGVWHALPFVLLFLTGHLWVTAIAWRGAIAGRRRLPASRADQPA